MQAMVSGHVRDCVRAAWYRPYWNAASLDPPFLSNSTIYIYRIVAYFWTNSLHFTIYMRFWKSFKWVGLLIETRLYRELHRKKKLIGLESSDFIDYSITSVRPIPNWENSVKTLSNIYVAPFSWQSNFQMLFGNKLFILGTNWCCGKLNVVYTGKSICNKNKPIRWLFTKPAYAFIRLWMSFVHLVVVNDWLTVTVISQAWSLPHFQIRLNEASISNHPYLHLVLGNFELCKAANIIIS